MTETPEDSTTLRDPADLRLFIGRITDLTAQPCIATWMAVEVAAIAEFLYGGVITLNRVWQLLLPHFGMAPTVSSTPGPETDQRLVLPLRMRDIVWHDLSELHKGAVLPALPVLPAPGGRSTSGAAELMEDYLATLMRGLSLLHARGLSGESVLKRLEYGLANDIEQHLAAKWLSDPFVIGAGQTVIWHPPRLRLRWLTRALNL